MTPILLVTIVSQFPVMAPPPPGTVKHSLTKTPQIYVSLDESRQADFIHVWADKPLRSRYAITKAERRKLDYLNSIRRSLNPIVCDWNEWERRERHRIPQFDEPRYRFGRYGRWHSFPERCWIHPTFSLLWLHYESQRWNLDERMMIWEDQCDKLKDKTRYRYYDMHSGGHWYVSGMRINAPPMPTTALRPSPQQLSPPNPLDW